jgi:hypothetical protein
MTQLMVPMGLPEHLLRALSHELANVLVINRLQTESRWEPCLGRLRAVAGETTPQIDCSIGTGGVPDTLDAEVYSY